ncbi:hypothetical protein [Limnoglobus roseus]|uniref:Uncharacterized protein n=1 Tax=Limnoglobus roseus TaxID=2598579 RepID=A0A5C1A6J4_9BACT|nr:hypothetical protein [Limnoglobus roseus]QEL14360.1 hypothetical protein PX52LOC_01248 [Limnoglobus roseus]
MQLILAGLSLTFGLYVGTYYRLSRRGMAEARTVGFPYFFYCPLSDVKPYQDIPRQHVFALFAFVPLNALDRIYFGGTAPCGGITWGFTRPEDKVATE